MPKKLGQMTSFTGGIADSAKRTGAQPNSFAYGRALDFRSNPSQLTTNPKSQLDSGSVVTDLVMWADRAGDREYFYGDDGNIYLKNSDTWSLEHTANNSSGNGLAFFGEDRSLYYAQDKTIGRLTDAKTADGQYYDGFLESEGGEPTNTQSLSLEADNSEYASVADSANNSPTSDISIESYINPESLPTSGNEMVLMSKWNEQSDERGFKFSVIPTSASFGDGSDGALTISSNTTEAPIDASCSGTAGTQTLNATNASFAAGQQILIIQMQGTNAGTFQETEIQSYSAGTITTTDPLDIDYSSSGDNAAQVIVGEQYSSVTIDAGVTYSAKAWDGTVGGIMYWFCNGDVDGDGTISADFAGFRGGAGGQVGTPSQAFCGEGIDGPRARQQAANGNGGGGGKKTVTGADINSGGGGGGGHANPGGDGNNINGASTGGEGGEAVGDSNLASLFLGGGGGGGAENSKTVSQTASGKDGGGALFISGDNIKSNLTISADGQDNDPSERDSNQDGDGGPGAGGSILLRANTYGSPTVTAVKGARDTGGSIGQCGPASDGRIAIYYATSATGTTNPTATKIQDSSLTTTSGHGLRLSISSDGTSGNSENYTQEIGGGIDATDFDRFQVTWDSSASEAKFYKNASLIGTKTGSITSINDSTADLAIGASFDSSGNAENFYDGLIDDVRLWNDVRTQSELSTYNDRVLNGTEPNLLSYFEFEGDLTDSQSGGNNDLTHSGSATFSTDVPFSGVTTRGDEDVAIESTGSTYTLETSIDEASTKRQTFTPTKEPVKSIMVDIDTVGTGDWTFTIHDALNREVASKTVTNSELFTGKYEVIFDTPFRPVLNANYHVHITSTVADGKVVTSSLNDLEGTTGNTGAYLKTFFQILVDDDYHPIAQHLNFLVVGNERYVAKLEAGNIYEPHELTLPSGYRVRCFAYWREFLVIGTWRGDEITDRDQGRLFFWDGTSDTYNHFIDVPEGGVNAMYGTRDILYLMAGYEGKLLVYSGGGSAEKVDDIPEIAEGEYAEIAPGAMTMWRSILRYGATINTDSSNIHKGVYGYGTLNRNYPEATGFDFPLSLGDQTGTDVKVGCLFPSGQSLYASWEIGNSHGVDRIDVTNEPYNTATIELLIDDLDQISKEKYPLVMRADFEPLDGNQTVTIKFKDDREANWKSLRSESDENATYVRSAIEAQSRELQLAVDIENSSSSVVLTGISLFAEDPNERTI